MKRNSVFSPQRKGIRCLEAVGLERLDSMGGDVQLSSQQEMTIS